LWKSPPGFARHIHFVCTDLNNKEWIYFGTGDYDNEPGLYKLNIETKKIEIIGEGDQKWRAVDLIQYDNKLIWGTDCEYDQNYIFSYNLSNGHLSRIATIPGPAYYTTRDKLGNLYIGTTIEDRKKHKACILKSNDGQSWKIIKEFKKDMWHSKLFGYGVIEFIHGQENLNKLYYNLVGLKEK
jgi:hypothetical protein